MEEPTVVASLDELNLAFRSEESALRRYQAVHWLEYLVGPLGISNQPSEKEFLSCLRSGLILCNALNKVQPNSVPKVVENSSPPPSHAWSSQPLPAYQYFENVRNFLVAAEDMKLPAFEASVFEREILEEGSACKVVDCILALKCWHERKQMRGGNMGCRQPRSPLVDNSSGRIYKHGQGSHERSKKLDAFGDRNRPTPLESDTSELEDKIVKALADCTVNSNEDNGNDDSMKFLNKILSTCLGEKFQGNHEMKPSSFKCFMDQSCSPGTSDVRPLSDISNHEFRQMKYKVFLKKDRYKPWNALKKQDKELLNIKLLLSSVRQEAETLKSVFQSDMKQLEHKVLEMSTAALGYQKAAIENRNLYNMVQDLKGNIRVYCRIRPDCHSDGQDVVHHIGEDGSLVIVNPKRKNDVKKIFRFNNVFGPKTTQDEVFKDTKPLIRSVMDGYNVCIFAYGQTRSGKTHTMFGSKDASPEEIGISHLALLDLFQLVDQRKGMTKYEIQLQMVEIYNEQAYDLLADDPESRKLEIRRCVSENSFVFPYVTAHTVKSAVDAMNLMGHGEANRAFGSNSMNIQSSHSHSVLSVLAHGEVASGRIFSSCLHLVDLASSDQLYTAEATGTGCKESGYINKSLICLMDIIMSLAQKNSHIPHRNSKLTLLLQKSLEENGKTLMLAHVNPKTENYEETISTLRIAQRVSMVELGAVRVNESNEALELKAQLESLKKALGEMRMLSEKDKETTVQTPPHPTRSSIKDRSMLARSNDIKKCTKTCSELSERRMPPSQRRLSLEKGTTPAVKSGKPDDKNSVNNSPVGAGKTEARFLKNFELEDRKSVTKTIYRGKENREKAPRSPVTTTPMMRIDTADMQGATSSRALRIGMVSDSDICFEIEKPFSNPNQGKGGGRIKKSLQTIGKLINGTEKRNQMKTCEEKAALTTKYPPKSPSSSSSGKALRRQSLTGIPPPSQKSRRSSLGGASTESPAAGGNETRKTLTPTQVRGSKNPDKRWI